MDTHAVINVGIPADLHRSLKAIAERDGRKLRTLVERSLWAVVNADPQSQQAQRGNGSGKPKKARAIVESGN